MEIQGKIVFEAERLVLPGRLPDRTIEFWEIGKRIVETSLFKVRKAYLGFFLHFLETERSEKGNCAIALIGFKRELLVRFVRGVMIFTTVVMDIEELIKWKFHFFPVLNIMPNQYRYFDKLSNMRPCKQIHYQKKYG